MATEERVSPFPLPPSVYYKLYSEENIKSGKAPEPPPPIKGAYSSFGANFETEEPIIRSLEQQGIERLYPANFNRQHELKKLNHSLLINFLELLDILIKEPSSTKRERKLGDITLLFINMHHLVNELRPHQARETLRVMMERQKRQRLETSDKLDKLVDQVLSLVQSCSISLQSDCTNLESSSNVKNESKDDGVEKLPSLCEENDLKILFSGTNATGVTGEEMNPGKKVFQTKPPDKGSFPLDHDGECKEFMLTYMKCLRTNSNDNSKCRLESKKYLQCRMDRELMAKEDFEFLGYEKEDKG